jgi:hypothetical protein
MICILTDPPLAQSPRPRAFGGAAKIVRSGFLAKYDPLHPGRGSVLKASAAQRNRAFVFWIVSFWLPLPIEAGAAYVFRSRYPRTTNNGVIDDAENAAARSSGLRRSMV